MKFKLLIITFVTFLNFTQIGYSTPAISEEQRQKAEQEFREKYSELDIPQFTFDSKNPTCYAYTDGRTNVARDTVLHVLDCLDGSKPIDDIFSYTAPRYKSTIQTGEDTHHFQLLHEVGHYDLSQKGFHPLHKTYFQTIGAFSIFYTWGVHRKIPYKNIFTKAISKTLAATAFLKLTGLAWARFHELYADDYACKHIKDRKPIETMIQDHEEFITKDTIGWNVFCNKYNIPLVARSPLGSTIRFLIDPNHPPKPKRIARMQKELDTRLSKK